MSWSHLKRFPSHLWRKEVSGGVQKRSKRCLLISHNNHDYLTQRDTKYMSTQFLDCLNCHLPHHPKRGCARTLPSEKDSEKASDCICALKHEGGCASQLTLRGYIAEEMDNVFFSPFWSPRRKKKVLNFFESFIRTHFISREEVDMTNTTTKQEAESLFMEYGGN